jgi:hypothetical protein
MIQGRRGSSPLYVDPFQWEERKVSVASLLREEKELCRS